MKDDYLAKPGWSRQKALDAWATWVSEIAPVRDARIQARYQDLVAQGLLHEVSSLHAIEAAATRKCFCDHALF